MRYGSCDLPIAGGNGLAVASMLTTLLGILRTRDIGLCGLPEQYLVIYWVETRAKRVSIFEVQGGVEVQPQTRDTFQ